MVLALLPDGFPDSTVMKKDLQQYLPVGFALSEARQAFRKVALVYVDERTQVPHIQLLSPIQHFCQANYKLSSELSNAITTFYANFIVSHHDYTIAAHHVIVPLPIRSSRNFSQSIQIGLNTCHKTKLFSRFLGQKAQIEQQTTHLYLSIPNPTQSGPIGTMGPV